MVFLPWLRGAEPVARRSCGARRPTIQPGQGDMRPTFVDKDELLWAELGRSLAPGGARRLVALAGCQDFF